MERALEEVSGAPSCNGIWLFLGLLSLKEVSFCFRILDMLGLEQGMHSWMSVVLKAQPAAAKATEATCA